MPALTMDQKAILFAVDIALGVVATEVEPDCRIQIADPICYTLTRAQLEGFVHRCYSEAVDSVSANWETDTRTAP